MKYLIYALTLATLYGGIAAFTAAENVGSNRTSHIESVLEGAQ